MTKECVSRGTALLAVISLQIIVICVSLTYASRYHGNFHFPYDADRLPSAIIIVALFSITALFFLFSKFSFGYVIAFYFFVMSAAALWINQFSDLDFNRWLADISLVSSAIAFCLPALFLKLPLNKRIELSARAFDIVLLGILGLALLTVVLAATYNFKIVGFENAGEFHDELFNATIRSSLDFPTPLRYMIGITSSSLLPFAFACFAIRQKYWLAAFALALLLAYFPIMLTKISLFTPLWLIFILLLSAAFEARAGVVLSLLVPSTIGLLALHLLGRFGEDVFNILDFRMIAIPSAAIGIYNDYFGHHELTHFCQIGIVRRLLGCHYDNQLGVIMSQAYHLGNYNASLFATEGIASVGTELAPIPVFLCGVLVAIASALADDLNPRLVFTSSSALAQVMLNVPFSAVLLTHGAALLFLLWYVAPRELYGLGPTAPKQILTSSVR
jgi:hypothetical protein